jgi:uncharacterized repeat protein (TIGR03803 family)
MKTKFTSIETQRATLQNGSGTREMTGPFPARRRVLALLMRMLWAAALLLQASEAQAGAVSTTLHSFEAFPNGAYPLAALAQGSDGDFYGTTAGDSGAGHGTVFKISTNGALTSLYIFAGSNDGESPVAGLVQGGDGSFYGTTSSGGQGSGGTVFRLTVVPAAPVLQAVTLTDGTLSLTWSTEAGGRYQLQFNSDLGSSNWANLGGALTAVGTALSATDSVTSGPRRFYRVVLAP